MKKFIYSLMLAFMLMFAVCCGKDTVDVNEVFESVFEGVTTTRVTENLELPTELDGVTIEWTSSHPDIVSETGVVTRSNKDVVVTLTAKLTIDGEVTTLTKKIKVLADAASTIGVITVAEALAAELGAEVTIQGTVSDIYQAWNDSYGNMSVKVTDETGTIIAFRITEKVEIGYVIKVVGTVDQYNNVNQIAQGSTVTIISSDVQQGETVKTVAEALAAKPGTKAEIEGEVVEIYQDWDAGYGNMSVYVQDSTGKMIAFRITEKVEIGYIIKVEGTITAYNNVNQIAQGSTTTVISTGVVLSDAEKVAADKEALELNEEVIIDFALESEGSKGSVITWEVTEGTAIVIEGTTAKVTRGTADATVKLTATITSGNETDTKVFTIVVKKVAEQPAGSVEVVYTFATSSTKQGSELNANTALTLLNNSTTSELSLVSVETTKVYDGNGTGGAYANQSGFLKMGTGSVAGVLKLQFTADVAVSKVEISCHDWYKKSDQYPTNSNKVSVNGSQEVLAPYNTEGTPEVLTFEVDGDNYVEITSNLRIFLFSIKITYEFAE